MIRIQEILDKVAANNHDANLELIQKAYVFAATAHAGQTRLSGEPYLSHPLAVAYTLADMGFDEPTVAVDPQSRNAILEGICRLRDEGATVVYTSHYMEEVEQICSRIMIMDGGRVLAQGTNDELKRMIQMGERVTVEVGAVEPSTVERLRALEHVLSVELSGGKLICTCEASPHNLVDILDTLRAADVALGRVWSEPPTLNDVFLEITGRELRD